MTEPAYRELAVEERATLEFLLIDGIPNVDQLRAQVASARVSGRCECGCATIDLATSEDAPIWNPGVPVDRIVAMAFSRDRDRPTQLLLHALGGRLTELEYVDMTGIHQQPTFPPTSAWQAPLVGPGPESYEWPEDD